MYEYDFLEHNLNFNETNCLAYFIIANCCASTKLKFLLTFASTLLLVFKHNNYIFINMHEECFMIL